MRQSGTSIVLDDLSGSHRAAALHFSLWLLFGCFAILLAATLIQGLTSEANGLFIAELILLATIILTNRGHYLIASHMAPFGLLLVTIYLAFSSVGYQDIILLGFPLVISFAGLLLGKYGTLVYAMLSTACIHAIYLIKIIRNTDDSPLALIPYGDFLVVTILICLIAALVYFASNNLSRSLESSQKNEIAMLQAKEKLEQHAQTLEMRTDQLLTGARIARAASSILDPDELGQQVVDLVCSRFELYYVGLFLLDETKQWAVLHAGTGTAGKEMLSKGHRLKVGTSSMVGWCIENRKARIALDVGKDAFHFDNPLLPLTRSELDLPLISRGEVIGGLSIQSIRASAFSEENIASFQAMADQLAVAISNANHYARLQSELTERQRVEIEVRQLNTELENRVAERTRELQAANENLTTLGQLKDEFVANVSHELRTPITSIMLYHSLIEARPTDTPRYIHHLKRETDRLARLIEDLLYISRLEQGRTSFVPGSVNLNRLIHDYIVDRMPLASQHQLSLFMEPQIDLPEVFADERMIGQVLSILLTNAMNYTPSGGSITIKTVSRNDEQRTWVGFEVSDNGPGISVEEQEHIFERFFRGKAGHDSQTAGTGLGLSIAQSILEKHNGQISVRSPGELGDGTTFSVWLPVEEHEAQE